MHEYESQALHTRGLGEAGEPLLDCGRPAAGTWRTTQALAPARVRRAPILPPYREICASRDIFGTYLADGPLLRSSEAQKCSISSNF